MPTLTTEEERLLRSWVGQEILLAELQTIYDDLEDLDEVVLEVLRAKLAVLTLDQPTSISIDGISMSFGEAIKSIRDLIDKFQASGGLGLDDTEPSGSVRVTQMTRPNTR